MSIFGHRKPPESVPARDSLQILRAALAALGFEPETPRIVDLKHILADRIAELENRRTSLR
jgi:hypothetical protein